MNQDILREDREQVFSDWGQELTYRVVSQVYHPETQQVDETYADQTVTVLFEEEPRRIASETGGAFFKREIVLHLKCDEVPTGEMQLDHRLVWEEREYEPVEVAKSEDGLTMRVRCRER